MIIELAVIEVIAGREDDFAAAYVKASEYLAGAEGCISATMTRGVESPSRFVGIVRWESIEAHRTNFRGTDRYTAYANLLKEYLASPPSVEHYTVIDGVPEL
jgi:heme-degrading monooxygenase HmoA